jgi:hypothetical protein
MASSGGSANGGGGSGTSGASGNGAAPGSGGTGMTTGGSTGFPGLDGGAAECLNCVTMNCPQAQACLTDPACIQGSICAATTCVQNQDAGDGLTCWLGCFDGGAESALNAFSAFSCLLTNCGTGCASAFGR